MEISTFIIADVTIKTMYEHYYVGNVLKCVQSGQFEQRLVTPWQKN